MSKERSCKNCKYGHYNSPVLFKTDKPKLSPGIKYTCDINSEYVLEEVKDCKDFKEKI